MDYRAWSMLNWLQPPTATLKAASTATNVAALNDLCIASPLPPNRGTSVFNGLG
jgi:hypothetical protein